MNPENATRVLRNAMGCRQPVGILEISDNSVLKILWWMAIPINKMTALVVSLFARPTSWQQLVFTYLMPLIPIAFAWDGAISNAGTYTLSDLDTLLQQLRSDQYTWEKGVISVKSSKIYQLGYPS